MIIETERMITYIKDEKRIKRKIALNVGKKPYHIKKMIITTRFAKKTMALWAVDAMMIVHRDKYIFETREDFDCKDRMPEFVPSWKKK